MPGNALLEGLIKQWSAIKLVKRAGRHEYREDMDIQER